MDEIKRERDERGENGGLGFRRGGGSNLVGRQGEWMAAPWPSAPCTAALCPRAPDEQRKGNDLAVGWAYPVAKAQGN